MNVDLTKEEIKSLLGAVGTANMNTRIPSDPPDPVEDSACAKLEAALALSEGDTDAQAN